MEREIVCTVCPRGCRIKVSGDGEAERVEGHSCERGRAYAVNEFLHPVRILTTTVLVKGGIEPLLAVRTDRPVPKEKLFECMAAVKGMSVRAPVERHAVIIKDICGTGADLVASGGMPAR